jgi:hypothetical protein
MSCALLYFSYLGVTEQQKSVTEQQKSVMEQQRSIEEGRQLAYDNSTQQIIHAQYGLCREIDQIRLDHPELSHMFELPTTNLANPWTNYQITKEMVSRILLDKIGNRKLKAADKDNIVLKERAVGLRVFDIYEQTILQWQVAEAAKDEKRANLLKSLVEYYEQRMLRNPRLRYHWLHGGSDMMEEATRNRYNQNVGIDLPENGNAIYPSDFVDWHSPLDVN